MNAGVLPFLMLCTALGFALYATPLPQAFLAITILAGVAVLLSIFLLPPLTWEERLLLALWATTAVLAALVHLPTGLRGAAALSAALIAGVVLGLAAGGPHHVLPTLPATLLFLPAGWVRRRGYGIAIKIMSSWLIAISVLAAMVSLTPTPGYKQDHME